MIVGIGNERFVIPNRKLDETLVSYGVEQKPHNSQMKILLKKLKPLLRWFILGGTLFFLLKTLKDHWQEVTHLRLTSTSFVWLGLALLITSGAHLWSGWVWTWILKEFGQHFPTGRALRVYLVTNAAKYLPGNVWHFWGRIQAVSKAGSSAGTATLSVLLEPLLMAAAALLVASALSTATLGWWTILGLIAVLVGVHPRILNQAIALLDRLKDHQNAVRLKRYLWRPLMGEVFFLLFRGAGFVAALAAISSVHISQLSILLSAFSFAWLLGLVIPGAPGGLGVFETTAIALLEQTVIPGELLGGVALFRLVSILAEIAAAGIAWVNGPKLELGHLKPDAPADPVS
ncbi:MAG: lysylphosphatidylglycerol synthase domain-containing protein [Cyanobacteria bacterium P01_H01_bin.15]